MNAQSTGGVCPHCGLEGGKVGMPCSESVCSKQGYHSIPRSYAGSILDGTSSGEGLDPQIGRMVDRYLVVGVVGRGGMGSVYLALQMPLEREVALKMVSGVHLDDTAKGRFEREAKAISMLYHPNIVQLYEYGFNPRTGAPFMSLEYVKGGRELSAEMIDLRESERAWEPDRVRKIFEQALSALQTAHGQGLVHRDIKPQNIMLVDLEGNRDFVKILDFGLARTLGNIPGMEKLTGTGTVVGTPQYMAPEQLVGGAAMDRRTDIYSMGSVLFEVVTGLTAYPSLDPRAVLALKLDASYHPVERLPAGSIHPPLLAVIETAMSRDPDDRYETASAMRDALAIALDGAGPMGQLGLVTAATQELPSSGGELARPAVDPIGVTIPSEEAAAPMTEQLAAFERPSAVEHGSGEVEVPGRVPTRLIVAGALTGLAIVALVLVGIFVVLPRLGGSGPAEGDGASEVASSGLDREDASTKAGQETLGSGAVPDPGTPDGLEPEPGEDEETGGSEGGGGKKPRPKPKPGKDASSGSTDPGSGAGEDPAPVDTGPKDSGAGGKDPKPKDPGGGGDEPPPLKKMHGKLRAVTSDVKACLPQPQGTVSVNASFDSSTGKVTDVDVSGFFTGGAGVKTCIVGVVSGVEVNPWKGEDHSVFYTYSFKAAEKLTEDQIEKAVDKKLDAAKGWIVACAGDMQGKVRVRVVVDGKTGKARKVTVISEPFKGTKQGECMEKSLAKMLSFPTMEAEETVFFHTFKIP